VKTLLVVSVVNLTEHWFKFNYIFALHALTHSAMFI